MLPRTFIVKSVEDEEWKRFVREFEEGGENWGKGKEGLMEGK